MPISEAAEDLLADLGVDAGDLVVDAFNAIRKSRIYFSHDVMASQTLCTFTTPFITAALQRQFLRIGAAYLAYHERHTVLPSLISGMQVTELDYGPVKHSYQVIAPVEKSAPSWDDIVFDPSYLQHLPISVVTAYPQYCLGNRREVTSFMAACAYSPYTCHAYAPESFDVQLSRSNADKWGLATWGYTPENELQLI